MHLTRPILLAAAFASLAFAAQAAAQSGHGAQRPYPRAAGAPRVAGSPRAMDPHWAFAFDPLMSEPGWTADYGPNTAPTLSRGPGGLGGPTDAEVQRMMADMDREMAAMVAGPAWGPLGFDLGFGDIGYGLGMPGYAGMGGPTAGSAAAWSYSSETDENGCTRSREMAARSPGPAPNVVTRAEGHCTAAPGAASDPQADDDLDADVDEPDGDEPDKLG